MPWKAIQYVTSGLTLAAFFGVILLSMYRRRLLSRERLIGAVPEEKRYDLVRATLDQWFHVDTNRLTKQQAHELAMQQIRARSKRYLINAVVLSVMSVIAFSSAFYIWRTRDTGTISIDVTPVVPNPGNGR
jgi:hypothetical protein